jgi:hypothetical protein
MCPAGDLDLGLDAENRLEGVHEKRVVVGDQDANDWGQAVVRRISRPLAVPTCST